MFTIYSGTQVVPISERSFLRLRPPTDPKIIEPAWLDDNIIGAYFFLLENLSETFRAKGLPLPKIFAVTPQLYTPWLTSRDPERVLKEKVVRALGNVGYQNDYDMEFIPFNQGGDHWVLYVIERKLRRYRYYNGCYGGIDHRLIVRLANLLDDNAAKLPWTFLAQECPPQEDGFNCGVIACAIAECLARGRPVPSALSTADLENFRIRIQDSFRAGVIQAQSGMLPSQI